MIEIDPDYAYRKSYAEALAWAEVEGPAWDDLSEDQKERIRASTRQYQREMNALGDKISRGEV